MKTMSIYDNNREFNKYLKEQFSLLNIEMHIENNRNKLSGAYDFIVINDGRDIEKNKGNFEGKYILLNMDMPIGIDLDLSGMVVTYGLGNRNTITVSSMEKDKESFVYCLQRCLNSHSSIIQPEEIPINSTFKDNYELYSFMVTITIALIEGINSCNIRKLLLNK
ncbi:hypothetical protein BD780_003077 [Clostridium tetanomorphum]|uniref:Uncharacterized protein n=1 Tax=Clostridium tetanomorphum TaxID=1553 RepID=A0A923EAP3_CLOTT|nr:hypothetical protein [Clostridium tetanomorphum]KAJ50450.1 hypothetical protein CTM_17581 [Clostridium tetanomorphum DSM 665]MBC2398239.1 hypothetical protein [Clostridium tetanomorphum]MBP1865642.1 hypothetical protein [Clostridium tetanomorphum]NRS85852.1 hypothetical protein [Clostridium tetanomorphum]NRZ96140.1 hypothetical protein [Clostridium tetanomorphum]